MNIIITQFYRPENEDRFNEIKYCLQKNIQNNLIDFVAVLVDPADVDYIERDDKLKIFETRTRPTYKDHFEIGKSLTEEGLIIVMNSDIYITEYDTNLVLNNLDESKVYILSRWDLTEEIEEVEAKHHNTWDSQDTWIFRNTIKPGNYEITLGTPGCDNRIAYELLSAGYDIKNPSKTIKTYHYHLSNYRSYKEIDRLEGEFFCITPKEL